MTTERISVTIDGMKIFHACTDRMDPVTSYVETVNLRKVSLGSGFEANPNASNHIGGSLDLKLNKSGFCCDGFSANANTGYETYHTPIRAFMSTRDCFTVRAETTSQAAAKKRYSRSSQKTTFLQISVLL